MKLPFAALIAVAMVSYFDANSQAGKNQFKEAKIVYKDQSTASAWINANQLLTQGRLSFRDSINQLRSLRNLYSIEIDSNVYLFKTIKNRKDSVAVLITAIEGKVSIYTPPLESGLEAIFAEKDGASYELRQKVIVENDKKFYRNEYRQFLQSFFTDCPAITTTMVDRVAFAEKSIMKIVSAYNQQCGWEKKNVSTVYHAKFQFGLQLEGIYYNSTKGAFNNYFKGDRPAKAFGVGLYARLDFARSKTAFLISEVTVDKISGGGHIKYYVTDPSYIIRSELHDFDITEIRNTYSANFNIMRRENSSLSMGGGFLFQYQLSNKSTFIYEVNNKMATSVSSKDKFGISPVINLLYDAGRLGFGYQMVLLSTQLKAVEGQHLEHKIFVRMRLSKR
jgi:hypothetical protein